MLMVNIKAHAMSDTRAKGVCDLHECDEDEEGKRWLMNEGTFRRAQPQANQLANINGLAMKTLNSFSKKATPSSTETFSVPW